MNHGLKESALASRLSLVTSGGSITTRRLIAGGVMRRERKDMGMSIGSRGHGYWLSRKLMKWTVRKEKSSSIGALVTKAKEAHG